MEGAVFTLLSPCLPIATSQPPTPLWASPRQPKSGLPWMEVLALCIGSCVPWMHEGKGSDINQVRRAGWSGLMWAYELGMMQSEQRSLKGTVCQAAEGGAEGKKWQEEGCWGNSSEREWRPSIAQHQGKWTGKMSPGITRGEQKLDFLLGWKISEPQSRKESSRPSLAFLKIPCVENWPYQEVSL